MVRAMELVRDACAADLEPLTEIYNHYIVHTAVTFHLEPLTVEQRRPWFEQACAGGRYRLVIAEREGRAVGWACTHPFRSKGAYVASVESSVYLAPDATGAGLGDRLYRALFERLAGADVRAIVAAIALPNDASRRLHLSHGFESVGVMRSIGRKLGREWDVEWFQRLNAPASVEREVPA
jgi:phosphinothricin acetyltransferase